MHRYLGTAIGILIVGWCLSGIVMMYERYPELAPTARLQRLPPINWQGCCHVSSATVPPQALVASFQVESLAGRPVLQVQFADGQRRLTDLDDGRLISAITAAQAAAVARGGALRTPRLLGLIDYDQWTVSAEFNRARPLYLFALDDPAGTQVYISGRTGRMIQLTSARQRLWNWLGAVPHWLYFAQLRHHAQAWNQVVIWTSLAGCFLTLFGIYIGLRQFLRRPVGRWSGYRGMLYWHHVPGLLFGLFALTWVASGLVSMNPWGFLDSTSAYPAADDLVGPPTSGSQLMDTLQALPALPLAADVVAVTSTRLWGRPYLIEAHADGTRERVNLDGTPASLTASDWRRIGSTLAGTTAIPERITQGDPYYHSRPGVPAPLPVYRLILDDQARSRIYLDPLTGTPLQILDADARAYRWLHVALHTLDFSPLLRSRPLWDVLMVTLLLGVSAVGVTGTWLGWRRYIR